MTDDWLSFEPPVAVAYGGGVDSTAMLIEMQRRGCRPDLILFADTGSEKPETLDAISRVDAWLAVNGFPPIVTVRNPSPIAGDKSLGAECLRKSMLPSLAYGRKGCSIKWKVEPQNRYVRGWPPAQAAWAAGRRVTKLIGYDASPADRRRYRDVAERTDQHYHYRYPLIESGIDRTRCEEIIAVAGLAPIPKSACWFCPASKPAEVDWLARHHPDLAAEAVEMEHRARTRGLRTVKGLGRNWSWTDRLNQMAMPGLDQTTATEPHNARFSSHLVSLPAGISRDSPEPSVVCSNLQTSV